MKWLINLFQKENKKRQTEKILIRHEQSLQRMGREQFIKLKEKGLSIPIFTL